MKRVFASLAAFTLVAATALAPVGAQHTDAPGQGIAELARVGGLDVLQAVAALTNTGAKASYSNYGATTVDLAAPGSGVYSTVPSNSYGSMSGTSMAAPHATGGVALYASTRPTASAAQIRSAILGSTVPTASMAGRCVTGGRQNVSGF